MCMFNVDGQNNFLEEAQNTLESTKEHVSQPTDDVLETYDHHFEEERRQVALMYHHLDLSPLDPFKVIMDGELVDEE